MKHYKHPDTGLVYAYDTAEDREKFGPSELVPITDNEAKKLVEMANPKPDEREVAISYLLSTDWYLIRKAETGADVPPDVLSLRAEARIAANR